MAGRHWGKEGPHTALRGGATNSLRRWLGVGGVRGRSRRPSLTLCFVGPLTRPLAGGRPRGLCTVGSCPSVAVRGGPWVGGWRRRRMAAGRGLAARSSVPALRDGVCPLAPSIAPSRRPRDYCPPGNIFCNGGCHTPLQCATGCCSRGTWGRGGGDPHDPTRVREYSRGWVFAPPGAEGKGRWKGEVRSLTAATRRWGGKKI